MNTPLPIERVKNDFGGLFARLLLSALIIAGAAAGIASRWTP